MKNQTQEKESLNKIEILMKIFNEQLKTITMGYLKRLISEKEAKEKFDRDVDRMRIAIVSIESLVSLHDGEFLDDLENLLTKWKNKEK